MGGRLGAGLILLFYHPFLDVAALEVLDYHPFNLTYYGKVSDFKYPLSETGGLVSCFRQNVDNIYSSDFNEFPVMKFAYTKTILQKSPDKLVEIIYKCWNPFKNYPEKDATVDFEWHDRHCLISGRRIEGLEQESDRCLYCPLGYVNIAVDDPLTSPRQPSCKPKSKISKDLLLPRNYADLKELQMVPRQGYCPWGTARNADGTQCIMCAINCQLCAVQGECFRCRQGFFPYYNNVLCGYVLRECPRGTMLSGVRCLRCDKFLPNCAMCGAVVTAGDKQKFNCERCDVGYFLSRTRRRQKCTKLCNNGFYYDATDQKCAKCPGWCRECDKNGCKKCRSGLYNYRPDRWKDHVQCYYQCPNMTYAVNRFPFRCEPCAGECRDGCYGPTSQECFSCWLNSEIDLQGLVPRCLPMSRWQVELLENSDSPGLIWDIMSLSQRQELVIESSHTKIRHLGLIGIFSRAFATWNETESYYKNNSLGLSKPLPETYAPWCNASTCLDHCQQPTYHEKIPETFFHPCPKCEPGYVKDLWGNCVDECKNGTFRDDLLQRCITCDEPVKCNKCRWKPNMLEHYRSEGAKHYAQIVNRPMYWKSEVMQEEDLRQECYEWQNDMHGFDCHLDTSYEDQLGYCRPCHPECLGCVGDAVEQCIKCRHFLDPEGRCVQKCAKDYYVEEPIPGYKVCSYARQDKQTSYIPQGAFIKAFYDLNMWLQLVAPIFLCIYLGIQFLGVYGSRFTGEIDDAELLCWRYEDVIREAAWTELELWVFMRKTKSKSSSSHDQPALLTSMMGLLRITSSTSSSAQPRAFGYNTARLIIRRNLHRRARLNMRLKKTISKRPTIITATRPTMETATTQDSRQGTGDAESFTNETQTTGTGTADGLTQQSEHVEVAAPDRVTSLTTEDTVPPNKPDRADKPNYSLPYESTTTTAENTIMPQNTLKKRPATRSRPKSTTSTGENTMVPQKPDNKSKSTTTKSSRAKSTTSTTENTMAAQMDEAENPPVSGSPDRTEW